ncbi:MAG: capsule assembly Wzi family protein [Spirochaetales bacterium]|jgi:hypothetical protein|nr:capsule assembly Wzi family protein [Spirochaetales bacterium]
MSVKLNLSPGLNDSLAGPHRRFSPLRWLFLGLLLGGAAFPAFAQSQEIIPLGSPLYRDIDALCLMAGLARPSASRPWTINEARLNLDRLDPQALSAAARGLYDRTAGALARGPALDLGGGVQIGAGLELNLETYGHTNTEDYITEEDWFYGYEERQPSVRLNLEGRLGEHFFSRMEGSYGLGRFNPGDEYRIRLTDKTRPAGSVQDGDNPFPNGIGAILDKSSLNQFEWRIRGAQYAGGFRTNITTPASMGSEWPRRAYFSAGGSRWNFSLSRDRLTWGNGESGNLILDGNADFNDYARFNFFHEALRYEYLMVFFKGFDYWNDNFYKLLDPNRSYERIFRIFLAHRLEFRLRNNLSLSLSEGVMYQDSAFELRFLNPSFFLHNYLDKTRFNAIASIEWDWTPGPGWGIYGQFALDQATAPTETGSTAGDRTSFGVLGGLRRSGPLFSGVLDLNLEGVYTSPMLYRRNGVDLLVLRTAEFADDKYALEYLGYPYGGDAIVLQLGGNYRDPSGWEAGFRFFGMLHGRMHFLLSHNTDLANDGQANIAGAAPLGRPEEVELTLALSLNGRWELPSPVPAMGLSLWVELDGVTRRNKLMYSETGLGEEVIYHLPGWSPDLQLTLGMGLRF